MNRALSIDEKRYSKLVDDIYYYLYNNYREVSLEEGVEPVSLSEFLEAFLNDVESFKQERQKNLKYKLYD